MSNTIKITKDEYFRLRLAKETLEMLECGGVDNWGYYGDALNPDGEDSIDDIEESLTKEIYGVIK